MEAGSPTAPKAKGGFVDERHTKFNTFQVEMPVPYRNIMSCHFTSYIFYLFRHQFVAKNDNVSQNNNRNGKLTSH